MNFISKSCINQEILFNIKPVTDTWGQMSIRLLIIIELRNCCIDNGSQRSPCLLRLQLHVNDGWVFPTGQYHEKCQSSFSTKSNVFSYLSVSYFVRVTLIIVFHSTLIRNKVWRNGSEDSTTINVHTFCGKLKVNKMKRLKKNEAIPSQS